MKRELDVGSRTNHCLCSADNCLTMAPVDRIINSVNGMCFQQRIDTRPAARAEDDHSAPLGEVARRRLTVAAAGARDDD